ncbi:MAG: DUF4836 family protein [Bacteroidetes bacterium]|nr:DUF4836 family protein [Bacteroidota bacterium]
MRRYLRFIVVCIAPVILSACHSAPDSAQYIPKDAIVVASVDVKTLTKKVAWTAITGSKLFEQMQQRMAGSNAPVKDPSQIGVDMMNTMYMYVKTGANQRSRVTALIPLADAGKWETYIKSTFPNATITQHGIRKEASLAKGVYVGWSPDLLIIMNLISSGNNYQAGYTTDSNGVVAQPPAAQNDLAALQAEMENAFATTKDNSLIQNEHFKKLQSEGHDISFWLNYDQVMQQGMYGMMSGLTLANTFWKDAALTAGFDFDRGKINGLMHYYTSADMKDLGKDLGSSDADKSMLEMLPKDNMDLLMTYHLSPKGTKSILEKAGVLGLVNIAIAQQNMDADYVLDAFTGDMALVLNDFSLQAQGIKDSSMGTSYSSYKPVFNGLYALKINKKENFNKLLSLAKDNGLVQTGVNSYALPIGFTDSVILITDDNYAVVSNKSSNARAYLQGSYKGQKMPAAADVYGHPFAMFMDVQQMAKAVDPSMSRSPNDATVINEGKKLLSDISVNGGAYKNDAFEYKIAVNFMNKDENSLLQLIDFATKMNNQ